MTFRTRALPAALALLLAATLGAGTADAQQGGRRDEGAAGMGDPYYPQDGNGGIDVLHYDVRVGYSFGPGRLTGRTGLDVRATQDLDRFNLDFLLGVTSVSVDGRRARFEAAGDHELRITPAEPLAAGQQFRVVVRYAGTPASESSQGESNWLANGSEVVAMNEPHMATWWFPANDHPRDKATYDIHVTVPRGKEAIANGVLVGKDRRKRTTTWHWRAVEPMASYLAFFAAGSYSTRVSTCGTVTNYIAVSRQQPRFARAADPATLGQSTCNVITAFSQVLGPYPFSATGGLVTSLPVMFALENQTRPTYPAIPGPTPSLVAHELAHQWFGDLVSVSNWRDIWTNEGFAQYLQEYYVNEVVSGRSMQTWLLQEFGRYEDAPAFWDLAIDDPGPANLFAGQVYSRGAMAIQALRHRLGDAAFWALLRTWLQQRAHGNGSVADFRALAQAQTGQDLTGFFDHWLHAKTVPARTAENGLV